MLRVALLLAAAAAAHAQQPAFPSKEGDFVARDFTFHTGEKLAELKLHYTIVGEPRRDPDGKVRNAIVVMHGTGGTGRAFLSAQFAGELFGKGQPLDSSKYFIILPDSVGHGSSSKPSDGLRAKFPHYNYEDMVRATHRLVTEGLGVAHLRLVMGTSMGAMHSWVYGYLYPDFMDALMPLASAPVPIAGRNRMFRAMIMQAITSDPDYQGGEYTKPPLNGLTAAQYALWMMTSSPLQLTTVNPTREQADAAVKALRERAARVDANDMLYHYDSSSDYNPAPQLDKIHAPLFAVNSADDEVNPPELGFLEREIKKVARGRYILIPTSAETRGHGTHTRAVLWKPYVQELMDLSEPIESSFSATDLELSLDPKSSVWIEAPRVAVSRDYLNQPIPGPPTEIRSRWTKDHLYLFYICPYDELNLKPNPDRSAKTPQLWDWEVAEAFIGWDYNHIGQYKEFQVSPQGEFIDLDINRDDPKAQQFMAWNSGMKVDARIDAGAKIWYGVMRIPWKAIDTRAPEKGRELRIGLYRIAGKDPNKKFYAWRPTGSTSFHVPKAFGTLRLK